MPPTCATVTMFFRPSPYFIHSVYVYVYRMHVWFECRMCIYIPTTYICLQYLYNISGIWTWRSLNERYFSLCTPIINLFYWRNTFFNIRSIILLLWIRLKKKNVYGNNYIVIWIERTKPEYDIAILKIGYYVSCTVIIINRHFCVLIYFVINSIFHLMRCGYYLLNSEYKYIVSNIK